MKRTQSPRRERPARLLRAAVVATATAVLAVALVGCSTLFDAPDVRIIDVRVSGIGISGATADVMLEVSNPNGFSLTAEELRYRLAFEDPELRDADEEDPWRTVASEEADRRVTVPAGERADVTVSVPFDYGDVGRAVVSLVREGALRYRLTGDILFDAPVGSVRVPFDDIGRVGL